METKLTENQTNILSILENDYPNGAFADEIAKDHTEYSLPSIRMTLVGLEKKNKVSKSKEDYEGKLKTKYTFISE